MAQYKYSLFFRDRGMNEMKTVSWDAFALMPPSPENGLKITTWCVPWPGCILLAKLLGCLENNCCYKKATQSLMCLSGSLFL